MQWLPVILILPYSLLLIKIFRSLQKIKQFSFSGNPSEFISVVIACRNEETNIPSLLNDIRQQDYPSEFFEVIIVNDNSTDGTAGAVSDFNNMKNLRIINNAGSGKKQALRTGILDSRGEYILTTDADCRVRSSWIKTIAAFAEKNKPDLIICPVQIDKQKGLFGRFQELEFLSLQGITAGTAAGNCSTMCNGANLAFTKAAYMRNAGNLHDELNTGDDVFLLHSLKMESNATILWLESENATVTTSPSKKIKQYLKQRARWISKGTSYSDNYTIFLGVSTFIAVFIEPLLLLLSVFYPGYLVAFFSVALIKAIPDYLILRNTALRYKRKDLMRWFILSVIVYPIYVTGVILTLTIRSKRKPVSFPFQKGT
jgi:cellulose synthase/poly-beta-1,6-N-acetylglucosamine synthase-like glycosyltransferase